MFQRDGEETVAKRSRVWRGSAAEEPERARGRARVSAS